MPGVITNTIRSGSGAGYLHGTSNPNIPTVNDAIYSTAGQGGVFVNQYDVPAHSSLRWEPASEPVLEQSDPVRDERILQPTEILNNCVSGLIYNESVIPRREKPYSKNGRIINKGRVFDFKQ